MTKSFKICKKEIYECYKLVKSNKGSAGADGVSMKDFEKDLKNNLYKVWNRLSSGSYFPAAVKLVEIPKATGGSRVLGIPTISDRIAQMVVKRALEPIVEPLFCNESYGYRPNKSAKDALRITRTRCWRYDFVVDLDISGFFDNIDHHLMMKAVRFVTNDKFIHLYVMRWLKADSKTNKGEIIKRNIGTPQGGVISPILANLFLHYAFDVLMAKNHPNNPFARYADDIVIHCHNEFEANILLQKVKDRLEVVKLSLNLQKSKIVYCKDRDRILEYPNVKFTFLGYDFQPRTVRTKQGSFNISFLPSIVISAKKSIGNIIRSWRIQRKTRHSIEEIALQINPIVRGWINYYCEFRKSSFSIIIKQLENILMRWSQGKYKKIGNSKRKAYKWIKKLQQENPNLFVYWKTA